MSKGNIAAATAVTFISGEKCHRAGTERDNSTTDGTSFKLEQPNPGIKPHQAHLDSKASLSGGCYTGRRANQNSHLDPGQVWEFCSLIEHLPHAQSPGFDTSTARKQSKITGTTSTTSSKSFRVVKRCIRLLWTILNAQDLVSTLHRI